MNKNWMILLPLMMALFGIIFWTIFFWIGGYKFAKMVQDFTEREFRGIVIISSEQHRGFHFIKIKDYVSDSTLEYSVPGSWFFKENNIRIGDSVSKEINNKTMTFYKLKNGFFEKCCEYELRR
jgi:hypothetical protein